MNQAALEHMINPVLPEQMPTSFTMCEHVCPADPSASFRPGLEGSYIDGETEIAFVVHAIIDMDYEGQWMFAQVAVRSAAATAPFGSWHYGFYYRGGDSSWDHWQIDIVHGTQRPSYATFGAYVDSHK